MSRYTDLVEYEIEYIKCNECGKKQRIKGGKTLDGWIETHARYKARLTHPFETMNVTGYLPPPGTMFEVSFCCKEHEITWFEKYEKSEIANEYVLIFGAQNAKT